MPNIVNARRIMMIRDFAKISLLSILVCSLMVSVLSFSGSAETIFTESEISEDTTWTAANSPYKIMNTVTVMNGSTLTIEPGVQVLFERNVMLDVEGSLVANGSSTERIGFKPLSAPAGSLPQALWEGLRFSGKSTEVFTLEFVDIMYARNGVTINSTGKATIDNAQITGNALSGIHVIGQASLIIRNNEIYLNRNGIVTAGNVTSGIEVTDNAIYENENGIDIDVSGSSCQVHNIIISGNDISSVQFLLGLRRKGDGIRIFCTASSLAEEAQIYEVEIFNNNLLGNLRGVYFYASGSANISNSVVSGNVMSFNTEGIRIFSGGNVSSLISDVLLHENLIFSNGAGISVEAASTSALSYDCLIRRNIVSANNATGIEVVGGARVNVTENSVAYNSHGLVVKSQGNWARRNDIYGNTAFGVYVEGGGTIDATGNYWGSSTGPYHEYLNMDGLGDYVNGNGVNLSFDPFLQDPTGVYRINGPPVAELEAITTAAINELLVFDASGSYDDSRVVNYFFDFGDGTSTWDTLGVVKHTYVSPGLYDVNLTVMDDLGVLSRNRMVKTINVTLPILSVSVVMNPVFVMSGGNASVRVHVTNGSYAVEGVMINVTSDLGGGFDIDSGVTDANGDFQVAYFPPEVSRDTVATITVAAFKDGFINGSKQVLFPVLVPSSVNWLNSPWFWVGVIGAGVGVVAGVVLIRRRRSKHAARLRARRMARANKTSA